MSEYPCNTGNHCDTCGGFPFYFALSLILRHNVSNYLDQMHDPDLLASLTTQKQNFTGYIPITHAETCYKVHQSTRLCH